VENPIITVLDAIEDVADLLLTREDVRIEKTPSDLIVQPIISAALLRLLNLCRDMGARLI